MGGGPLSGCTIVVTRPAAQARTLLARLSRAGASVIPFPVLAIEALPPASVIGDEERARIDRCGLAIFISRNAVIHGLPLIEQAGGLPDAARIACVGRGTAEELRVHGARVDLLPSTGANSEALLAELAAVDVAGMDILVIRGVGGRELLADTLRSRGAHVHYLEVYRRALPDSDPDILSRAWQDIGIDAIVVTSLDGLRNLHRLVSDADREQLKNTKLFVVSPAMVELCADLGYKLKPVLVKSPADDDIVTGLLENCAGRHHDEQDNR